MMLVEKALEKGGVLLLEIPVGLEKSLHRSFKREELLMDMVQGRIMNNVGVIWLNYRGMSWWSDWGMDARHYKME